MHVVMAVTPDHPARRSLSKRRNQPATWFQLATVTRESDEENNHVVRPPDTDTAQQPRERDRRGTLPFFSNQRVGSVEADFLNCANVIRWPAGSFTVNSVEP